MLDDRLKLEYVNCGVCNSNQWQKYASGKDYEYHVTEDEFQMVECQVCGNIYLNPRPSKEELSRIYPPNYYAYNYDAVINPLAIRAKDWLDRTKVKQWLNHVTSNRDSIRFLDVGCGNGRYLKMMHQLGVPKNQIYGIEMNQANIEHICTQGFQGYYGTLENLENQLSNESFDLIVIIQVLEHLDNPSEVIKSLTRLLSKGGILIVETPNTNSLDLKLFRHRYWGGYHFPRHWNLLNEQTLRRLATEQNLEVKSFKFLPAHAFWIFSLHHLIKDDWGIPWMSNFFNPFQNLGLLSLFTAFDLLRAKLGFRTSNIQLIAAKL